MGEPVPAAKGYNLDFLDKMDDPNFNPFETKTAVIEKFDSSAPQENGAETSPDQNPSQDKQETEQDKKAEEDSKEKKPVAKKPWLKKPSLKKAVRNEEAPRADVEEERVPVPGKAYNLDFLDKLDDPNFNPFETKSSVTNASDRLSENIKTLDLQPEHDETS